MCTYAKCTKIYLCIHLFPTWIHIDKWIHICYNKIMEIEITKTLESKKARVGMVPEDTTMYTVKATRVYIMVCSDSLNH